MVKAAKMLEN
jgi:tRNA-dihydrouridine synthase 1